MLDPGAPPSEAVTVVRPGLAQQNPVKDRIAVFLHHGDPDDLGTLPTWSDKPVQEFGAAPSDFAGYTIGGGVRYWRRFVIEIKSYLARTQEDRDTAREIFQDVQQRCIRTLRSSQALPLTDDFGESAILLVTDRIVDAESGGPPRSFNWRGKIYFQVLTESLG